MNEPHNESGKDPAEEAATSGGESGDTSGGSTPVDPPALARFPETLALVRLGPGAEVPSWAESSSVFAITATARDTTVLCAARSVPGKAPSIRPLTAFEASVPRGADVSGVLPHLLGHVASIGIQVFVLSAFDRDWLLVPADRAEDAQRAWREAGHRVEPAVPADPTGDSR